MTDAQAGPSVDAVDGQDERAKYSSARATVSSEGTETAGCDISYSARTPVKRVARARRLDPYTLKHALERVNEMRELATASADLGFLRRARQATLPLDGQTWSCSAGYLPIPPLHDRLQHESRRGRILRQREHAGGNGRPAGADRHRATPVHRVSRGAPPPVRRRRHH